MMQRTVCQSVERFKWRTTNNFSAIRSWRPSTVTCFEVMEQMQQCIRDNRKLSSDEIVSEMNMVMERNSAKMA